MSLQKTHFGVHPDGSPIFEYHLDNGKGLSCKVLTLGGILSELCVPDRNGTSANVALGLSTCEEYLNGHPFLGTITGRVAGRINGAAFTLDGKHYELDANDPPNHLHGGPDALDKKNWQAEADDSDPTHPKLTLRYVSPEGEMGYPGTLHLEVTTELTPDQKLQFTYKATTDNVTPLSLTNHAYFNLKGEGHPDLSGHVLQVFADTIVPKRDDGTLTDKKVPVENTPNDLRQPEKLTRLTEAGIHGENYFLKPQKSPLPQKAAVLTEQESGRRMDVFTTETSLQLYTAQTLGEAELTGKSGKPYGNYCAVCLECQGYPNGVNCLEIENILIDPEHPYHQTTAYAFSTF